MLPHASIVATRTPSTAWVGRFCTALIEAAWLAAAAVVPLLFDPNEHGGFEPAKTGMLRILAVLIIAAWFVRAAVSRRGPTEEPSQPTKPISKSFAIALTLLAAASVIAVVFSISPSESIWGERDYLQGVATTIAGMVIAGAVAVHLHTRAQVQRLIATMVLASIPMALYALVQAAGRDPINFEYVNRTSSLAGHAVYLGGYLCMVAPLALWKLVQARRGPTGVTRLAGTLFYSAIALLDLMAFFSSGSRGPLYGLAAGTAILGIGVAALYRQWRWLATGAAAASAALVFFLALNLHYGPAMRLGSALHIARYGEAMNLRGAEGFRAAHWREAAHFLISPTLVEFPAGGADPWHPLRRLLGYGPETLQHILPQRITWPSKTINIEDRFHNQLWDIWYSMGLLGFGAFLTLIVVLIHHGFASAGLLPPGQVRAWTATLAVGTGIGAAAAAVLGVAFLPLGMTAGLAAAVAAWPLVYQCWCRRSQPAAPTGENDLATLPIALLGSVTAGLIAESFAFPVGSTLVMFWLCAGLLAALYRGLEPAVASPSLRPKKRQAPVDAFMNPAGGASPANFIFIGSLILLTLVFAFMHEYSIDALTIGGVLEATLLKTGGVLLWVVLLPTILIAIGTMILSSATDRQPIRGKAILLAVAGLAGPPAGYAIVAASQIVHIGPYPSPAAPPDVALRQAFGYQWLSLSYVIAVGVLVVGWAVFGAKSPAGTRTNRPLPLVGTILALVLIVSAGAWCVSLRFLRPSITAHWGTVLGSNERSEAARAVLREAVAEQPTSVFYRELLYADLVNQAQRSAAQETFDRLMSDAEGALLPCLAETHGLSVVHFDLGRCYLLWAAGSPDPLKRRILAEKCGAAFERALVVEPNQPMTWFDSALLQELLLAQPEKAASRRNRARELFEKNDPTVNAEFFRNRCLQTRAPALRTAYAQEALYYFTRASEIAREPKVRGQALMAEGNWRFTLGDIQGATRQFTAALPFLPNDAWRIHVTLSEIARQQGDRRGCLEALALAIDLAPPKEKQGLQEIQRQLSGH